MEGEKNDADTEKANAGSDVPDVKINSLLLFLSAAMQRVLRRDKYVHRNEASGFLISKTPRGSQNTIPSRVLIDVFRKSGY